jgi:hypothetical protein
MIAAMPSRSSGWSSTLNTRIRAGSLIELVHSRWVNHLYSLPEDATSKTTLRNGQSLEKVRHDLGRTIRSPFRCCSAQYSKFRTDSFRSFAHPRNAPMSGRADCSTSPVIRNHCRAPESQLIDLVFGLTQFHSRLGWNALRASRPIR